MVEGIGVHAFDDTDIIDDAGQSGKKFRNFDATLSVAVEFEFWSQES